MNNLLLIFVGGGLGSLARYGTARALAAWSTEFPAGTLAANIVACFILGCLAGWLAAAEPSHAGTYRAFAAIGFCGGYSTFSTFSMDTVQLITSNRAGEAFINVMLSLVVCLGVTMAGLWAGRLLGS